MQDIRERGHPLEFGIVTPQMWRTWDEVRDLWTRAERAGFDVAFLTDLIWTGLRPARRKQTP